MRKRAKLVLMCAAVLALAGCTVAGGSPVVGHWGSDAAGAARLVFDSAGTFSGSDGCAPANGTWYQKGEYIHVTTEMMGAIACPPENWMNQVHTVQVKDQTLLVLDAEGRQIGQLPSND